jgi:hypothetical protein
MQEARAAMSSDNYVEAKRLAAGATARVQEALATFDKNVSGAGRKR